MIWVVAAPTSSASSEGAKQPRKLELGAKQAFSAGPPGTRSQHPPSLTGAIALLESGANGSGSTTYLHGVAAAAIRATGDLAADNHSSPRR